MAKFGNVTIDNSTTKTSVWTRQRYIAIRVIDSGKVHYVDMLKKRLKTLRENIFAWAGIAGDLKAERLILYGLSYDVKGTKVKASNWQAGDIREFIHSLKQRLGKRLLAYAWVAELQGNGNMHYHVAIYADGFLPYPDRDYFKGKRKYKKLWIHGASNVDWKPKGPYYLARYVGKEKQKDFMNFPKNARSYQVWFADKEKMRLLKMVAGKTETEREKIYKAEGWKDRKFEYLGSGYKMDYLKTIFPSDV